MPHIRVTGGKSKGKIYTLSGPRLVMGRDNNCEIRISDDGISREHAEICRIGSVTMLRDLGSRNGTFVNGKRLAEATLRLGDTIRVGDTELVFESSGTSLLYNLEIPESPAKQDSPKTPETPASSQEL